MVSASKLVRANQLLDPHQKNTFKKHICVCVCMYAAMVSSFQLLASFNVAHCDDLAPAGDLRVALGCL